MQRKRSPESIAQAKALLAVGQSRHAIAAHFQISPSTLRQWIDPDHYQRHIQRQLAWQKANKPIINARAARYQQNKTRAQKDRDCERQRHRYVTNPAWRENLRLLAHKYQRTAQGRLAHKIRLAHLGFSNRMAPTHQPLMEAITSLSRDQYTALFNETGHTDHIIPLCAFDLTNPEHLVRAAHQSNVRIIPVRANQIKGTTIPPNLNIMSLRWSENPAALDLATVFISRQLAQLKTLNEAEDEQPIAN